MGLTSAPRLIPKASARDTVDFMEDCGAGLARWRSRIGSDEVMVAADQKKSEASRRAAVLRRPLDRADVARMASLDIRGRTGVSPSIPSAAWQPFQPGAKNRVQGGEGPSLCVAVFRRLCPFEDERRFDPGQGDSTCFQDCRQNRQARLLAANLAHNPCERNHGSIRFLRHDARTQNVAALQVRVFVNAPRRAGLPAPIGIY